MTDSGKQPREQLSTLAMGATLVVVGLIGFVLLWPLLFGEDQPVEVELDPAAAGKSDTLTNVERLIQERRDLEKAYELLKREKDRDEDAFRKNKPLWEKWCQVCAALGNPVDESPLGKPEPPRQPQPPPAPPVNVPKKLNEAKQLLATDQQENVFQAMEILSQLLLDQSLSQAEQTQVESLFDQQTGELAQLWLLSKVDYYANKRPQRNNYIFELL